MEGMGTSFGVGCLADVSGRRGFRQSILPTNRSEVRNVCLLEGSSNLHFCLPRYGVYAWPTKWVGHLYYQPTPE